MKRIFFILSLSLGHYFTISQNLTTNWTFDATDKILASPLIHNETVYIGDQNGVFFSLDLKSGQENWRLETKGIIQAKATLIDGDVFFESANVFYLINGKTGKVKWTFDPGMKPFIFKYKKYEFPYKIDPYDDKRSTAFFHNGIIYIGCGNGKVYGLNAGNGNVDFEFQTKENSPVRSSPLVEKERLYFGDWNGIVYCYSLSNNQLIWKKKTYRGEKPYGTFGGVVSEFLIYDGLLLFGARNFMLNVLDISTGEKEWTYTDAKKGWVIGDPVVYNDTLYIGGSDNHSMLAFDPKIGRPIWSQNGGKNIYTKPVVTDKWVFYSSGDSYNASATGIIYQLDRMTGNEVAKFETSMGIFSSPLLSGDQIVFGCYDGKVYSLTFD